MGEERRSRRFQLQIPVLFKWSDQGVVRQGAGTTRDISAQGVFVNCNKHPPQGTPLVLEVLLPKLSGTGDGLRLKSEGWVVRTEYGDVGGFAAVANFGENIRRR